MDLGEIDFEFENKIYYDEKFTIGPIIIENFLPCKTNDFGQRYKTIYTSKIKHDDDSFMRLSTLTTVQSMHSEQNSQTPNQYNSNNRKELTLDIWETLDFKIDETAKKEEIINLEFASKNQIEGFIKDIKCGDLDEFLDQLKYVTPEHMPLKEAMMDDFVKCLHKKIALQIQSLSDFLKFNQPQVSKERASSKKYSKQFDHDAYYFEHKNMNKYLIFGIRPVVTNKKFASTLRNLLMVNFYSLLIQRASNPFC